MGKIINNPIFRICGIIAILYYGLFQNKSNPESLGNRLSPERIKSNLSDISEKSVYIIQNVGKAQELQKANAAKEQQDKDEKEKKEVKNEEK
jgi:FtsZ-interacting cell division protein ZipA